MPRRYPQPPAERCLAPIVRFVPLTQRTHGEYVIGQCARRRAVGCFCRAHDEIMRVAVESNRAAELRSIADEFASSPFPRDPL